MLTTMLERPLGLELELGRERRALDGGTTGVALTGDVNWRRLS